MWQKEKEKVMTSLKSQHMRRNMRWTHPRCIGDSCRVDFYYLFDKKVTRSYVQQKSFPENDSMAYAP